MDKHDTVRHIEFFSKKKEPYKSAKDIQLSNSLSPEGGVSSISPAEKTAAAISLEFRCDHAKVRNLLIPQMRVRKNR